MASTAQTTETKTCRCGCGESVGKKSQYKPGHDARHAGMVARAIRETPTRREELFATLGSDALRAKAARMIAKFSQPKKAAAPKPEPVYEVKVGRWWYLQTGLNADGGILYTSKDGQARIAPKGSQTRRVA